MSERAITMDIPDIDISFWPMFFLVAGGQAWLIAILLLTIAERRRSFKYLSAILFCFGYMLLINFCFWTNFGYRMPFVLHTLPPLNYLFGPLVLLYVISFRKHSPLHRFQWLHFVPAAILVLYLSPFYFMPGPDKVQVVLGGLAAPDAILPTFLWHMTRAPVFGAHLLLYLLWTIVIVRRVAPTAHSDTRQSEFRWFGVVIGLYALFVVVYLLYYAVAHTPSFQLIHDYLIALTMTACIYVIAYLGFRRPQIVSGVVLPQVFQSTKYSSSNLTDSAASSIADALSTHMEQEAPFLKSTLRIAEVAESIHTKPHDLSRVINERYGKTFNQYINDHRIQLVCDKLRDPALQHLQISEIAYSCGFNNKTTFNKAFKAVCGCSPSEFRKRLRAVQHPF